MSAVYELAARYRQQIDAEFRKTKSQLNDGLLCDRKIMLKHLSRLSRKVQDRGGITLRIMGMI